MYEKITLANGVRIIFEKIPYVRSVSVGIWIGNGSRFENVSENGASHFIEHMIFKGTQTHTASEIAAVMDGIGGQINAFTTKECTCFYGRVLDLHFSCLTDILCDVFFNSKFDESDISNERGVIFEEIDMYEDTPEDLVAERLFASVFKGSSLSRPILGKKPILNKMTGEFLKTYMREHYSPDSTVISVSGNFSPEDIDYLKERFSQMPKTGKNKLKTAHYSPAFVSKRKRIEQNHLCIGFPGISMHDERRYTMHLLSGILGGGMSSRLFQTVREKYGLCYSVYSSNSSYVDTGLFEIYTALSQETEQEALRVIIDELQRLKEDGVSEDELSRAREQIKANVLMGLESTSVRMNRLGNNELYFGYVPDPDEIISAFDSVSSDSVVLLARGCFDFNNISFSAVGKVDTADKYQEKISNLIYRR